MAEWAIARLDEILVVDDGREPMRAVRHHFGIEAFGVNAWTGESPGDRILNEHSEAEPDANEELYVVLSGRATFELDGERKDAATGTFVFVPPGVKRTAFAEDAGTTILAIGGTPGKPYENDGWELWAPLRPLYDAGKYDEAADRAAEILRDAPRVAGLYYNVACVESLAGRTEPALEHLRQAVEISERTKEFAKGDSDLDAIRGEPAFAEIMGE
jgi:mannose-6-phosphate isomerase-like protein (cupin superfamily)